MDYAGISEGVLCDNCGESLFVPLSFGDGNGKGFLLLSDFPGTLE